jgi:hypothetical protein
MFCPQCGQQQSETSRYCNACGASFSSQSTQKHSGGSQKPQPVNTSNQSGFQAYSVDKDTLKNYLYVAMAADAAALVLGTSLPGFFPMGFVSASMFFGCIGFAYNSLNRNNFPAVKKWCLIGAGLNGIWVINNLINAAYVFVALEVIAAASLTYAYLNVNAKP